MEEKPLPPYAVKHVSPFNIYSNKSITGLKAMSGIDDSRNYYNDNFFSLPKASNQKHTSTEPVRPQSALTSKAKKPVPLKFSSEAQ